MKKNKINIVVLIIALSLVLYFVLKDDFKGVIEEILKINKFIFVITIILFFISLIFKALSLKLFINEYYPSYSFKKTFSLTIIGQFLNGITPFSSGGQPFQIYLLKKEGLRITSSTKAMVKDHLSFQIALIFLGFIAFIINNKLSLFTNHNLQFLVKIGFLINLLVLFFVIFIVVYKNMGIGLINKILKCKILKKFKINKEKINDSLNYFYETKKEVLENKILFLKAVIYNIINLSILYVIPYFILLSLGINKLNILYIMISTCFVMLIGNFVPIPGATGGIEYGFFAFFSKFIGGSLLSSAIILWRGITYVFAMLIGFIVLIFRKKEVKK